MSIKKQAGLLEAVRGGRAPASPPTGSVSAYKDATDTRNYNLHACEGFVHQLCHEVIAPFHIALEYPLHIGTPQLKKHHPTHRFEPNSLSFFFFFIPTHDNSIASNTRDVANQKPVPFFVEDSK